MLCEDVILCSFLVRIYTGYKCVNHRSNGTYTCQYICLSHVFSCFGHNVRENVPCPGFLKPAIWNNESCDRVTSSIWIITGYYWIFFESEK